MPKLCFRIIQHSAVLGEGLAPDGTGLISKLGQYPPDSLVGFLTAPDPALFWSSWASPSWPRRDTRWGFLRPAQDVEPGFWSEADAHERRSLSPSLTDLYSPSGRLPDTSRTSFTFPRGRNFAASDAGSIFSVGPTITPPGRGSTISLPRMKVTR